MENIHRKKSVAAKPKNAIQSVADNTAVAVPPSPALTGSKKNEKNTLPTIAAPSPALTRSRSKRSFGAAFFQKHGNDPVVQRHLKESNEKIAKDKKEQEEKAKKAAEFEKLVLEQKNQLAQEKEKKRLQKQQEKEAAEASKAAGAEEAALEEVIKCWKRKQNCVLTAVEPAPASSTETRTSPALSDKYLEDTCYIPGSLPECCSDKTDIYDIATICKTCIAKMLEHHEPVCRYIKQGKCYSSRHNDFHKGGKARHNLINKSHQASAVFGTEIDQQVMDWLQDSKAKR